MVNGITGMIQHGRRTALADDGVTSDKIAAHGINYLKNTKQVPLVFRTKPKNLFNKNAVTTGSYVDRNTGNLLTNAAYTGSDYMSVTVGLYYALSVADQSAWYDGNKVISQYLFPWIWTF